MNDAWDICRATLSPALALVFVAGTAFVTGAACSSARNVNDYPKTGLAEGVVTLEPAPSPGEFLYRPSQSDLRDAREQRVGEHRFLLGANGQRWLVGKDGALASAPELAPEPLLGAGASEGRTPYWFLGKSGRVYRATAPLGAFDPSAITQPPETLVRVTAGEQVILGLTTKGRLLRSSDRGHVWSQVNVRERVADVAITPSGVGLALVTPEAFLQTRDGGLSFEPLAAPTLGALRLEVYEGGIEVHGVLGQRRWSPEAPSKFEPMTPRVRQPSLGQAALETYASALAVANGTGLLQQRYYAELEGSAGDLVLWRGRASDPLEKLPVAVNGCREPKLAGSRERLFLICGAMAGKVSVLRVYRSTDEGRTFLEEPYKVRGDVSQLRAAAWRDSLVWSGICPPEAEPTGCTTSGVHFAALKDGKVSFHELSLLGLSGVAMAMTVSPTSDRLLVFGATNKGDELTLYSGADPFSSFDVQPLRGVRAPRQGATNVSVEVPAWGEDGFVSATVYDARLSQSQLVIADDRGHVLQVRSGPTDASYVSGVGMKALAIEPRSGNAWESLDGGERWQSIGRLPSELCAPTGQSCELSVACFSHGCLISDELLRLGWGGQRPALEAPPDVALEKPKVTLQTPIVCRVAEDALWKTIPGGQIPEATGASLNDVDWFTHHVDWTNAAVTSFEMDYPSADGGARTSVLREEVVFDKRSDAAEWVLFSSSQTEGVAALRGRVDSSSVEVAWRNLFRGTKTHRWPVKPSGATSADQWSHISTRYLARAGQPGLVSISAGGVFVRPGSDEFHARTWLVREDGETRELPPFDWSEIAASGRTEMSQVGATPLGLKLFRNGAVLVNATLEKGGWVTHAMSIGVDEPGRFNLHQSYDLGYLDGQPHYHLWQVGPGQSEGWLFPLAPGRSVLGSPIAVATQRTLGPGDEPRVCNSDERRGPRIVAPAESETMHPIVVRHNSEPTKLFLSRNAVVYGPREKACVAVYEGESVARAKSEELSVLVRPELRQPSWTFRRAAGDVAFEYRPMACEFDENEPIPDDVADLIDDDVEP